LGLSSTKRDKLVQRFGHPGLVPEVFIAGNKEGEASEDNSIRFPAFSIVKQGNYPGES
jgi:hypothetical protein